MIARRRYRIRAIRGQLPYVSLAIAILYVVANLVHAIRIADLFWANASRVAYAIEAAVAIGYAVVAVQRGRAGVAAAAALILLFLAGQHLLFTDRSGAPVNFNVLFNYMPLFGFVVFSESRLSIATFARILLVVSAIYTFLYLVGAPYLEAHFPRDNRTLLPDHEGSGVRVYFVGAYAMFAVFAALRMRRMPPLLRGALIVGGISAVLLSDSRTFLALSILTLGLAVTTNMSRPLRLLLAAGIYGAMVVMLLGVFVPDWNPFGFFNDQSALTRKTEYTAVVQVIRDHWVSGVGLPTDTAALQTYLRTPRYEPVFGSDLGILGPWFDFGLIGLFAFFLAVWVVCLTPSLSRQGEVQAIQLLAITCALDGMISPMLLYEPTVIFFMLLIGNIIRLLRWRRMAGEKPTLRDYPLSFRYA